MQEVPQHESSKAQHISRGMAVIRMITGLLMAYHGFEVFSPEKMEMYNGWDNVKHLPLSNVMVHAGKAGELINGILLTLGWFTRISALFMAGIMLFITFYIGNGRFWYEDQHPFLFALMALVFAIYGPGAWAMDNKISKK
jgi:putative oxidoreductase